LSVSVVGVTRDAVLSDAQWSVIEQLLQFSEGAQGDRLGITDS